MRGLLRKRRNGGYTLLEVMISLGILAMTLSVLLGTQSSHIILTERANSMALAALLARSKMIDIEHEQLTDGFSDMEESYDGDFRDEGFDNMTWEALVEVVEITPDAEEMFVGGIMSDLFGDGESGGSLSGSSAVSQFLPMIVSSIPTFINEIGARVRKVTLVITWEDRGGTQSLTVQHFIVNMNPGGAEGEMGEPLAAPIGSEILAPNTPDLNLPSLTP